MDDKFKNVHISISTNTLIKILLLGVLVIAVIKLSNIILILFIAIVVASFVESAVKNLKPYIKSRSLSVFLVYITTIGIVVGLSSVFIPVFIEETSALVSSLSQYIPSGSILNTFQPDTISGAKDVVSSLSHNASLSEIINNTQTLISSMSGGFMDIFGGAFGGLFNFFLIIIISFYLSVTERGIENFLRIVTPSDSEEYIIGLWQRTEHKIGLWVQGQMLLGLIIGILTYLGLTILGVKYSLVLAIFTAFCELVPFGIFLAVIPATLFGFLDGGVTLALLSFGLYFILHQFENYLIYPLIIKKVIGISPLVVILSIIIGAELAGFLGIILAIPAAVCLLEFLDDIEKDKILSKNN
ncbi:MAG: AI-2E family transporter [Candidatus Nomurabacteria bacterium]|nr:AI-2E family transporter [Candidatus Nomurabacteria bacterium]